MAGLTAACLRAPARLPWPVRRGAEGAASGVSLDGADESTGTAGGYVAYSNYRVTAARGSVGAPFASTQGKLQPPLFSPRGTQVAWLGATDLNDPFAGSVFVPAGAVVALSAASAGTASSKEAAENAAVIQRFIGSPPSKG